MNSEDTQWLEKMFKQHNKDQQLYLDAKFETLATAIKEQTDNCQRMRTECRQCLDKDIETVEEQVDELEVICAVIEDDLEQKIRKNTLIGSAVAVILSLTLWAAFGQNAIAYVTSWIKLLLIGG